MKELLVLVNYDLTVNYSKTKHFNMILKCFGRGSIYYGNLMLIKHKLKYEAKNY